MLVLWKSPTSVIDAMSHSWHLEMPYNVLGRTVTVEHGVMLALWLWGCYYFYMYRTHSSKTPTKTMVDGGFRITYRIGRKDEVMEFPSAKTGDDALRELFQTANPKPNPKDILKVEKR